MLLLPFHDLVPLFSFCLTALNFIILKLAIILIFKEHLPFNHSHAIYDNAASISDDKMVTAKQETSSQGQNAIKNTSLCVAVICKM
jgi:hypothetical protein